MFWYYLWNILGLGWPAAIKIAVRKGVLDANAQAIAHLTRVAAERPAVQPVKS